MDTRRTSPPSFPLPEGPLSPPNAMQVLRGGIATPAALSIDAVRFVKTVQEVVAASHMKNTTCKSGKSPETYSHSIVTWHDSA